MVVSSQKCPQDIPKDFPYLKKQSQYIVFVSHLLADITKLQQNATSNPMHQSAILSESLHVKYKQMYMGVC